MVTRRTLLLAAAGAVAGAALPLPALPVQAWAQGGSADQATSFMNEFGNQLVTIVNSDASAGEKQAQMRPLIDSHVDVNGIATFVLGRYNRVATPEQRQHFDALFHRVLILNITSKLGEFRGVRFQLTQTTVRDGDFYVGTLIYRPNQQPNTVQWVVSTASGRMLLTDVVAEGTSLRLTQRADYGAYIARNGGSVDALISALERQVGGS